MSKQTLDKELVYRHLAATRSQAEDVIRRGFVIVNGELTTKPRLVVDTQTVISILPKADFVSRAGEKLYSVVNDLDIQFKGRVVLDVGSSTGGFTDVALQKGAKKVIAVDVGSYQLHPTLHNNPRVELHEKTDIRNFQTDQKIDLVLIDVSFVSLRKILPYIARLTKFQTEIIAMVKPQFEATSDTQMQKGVIKNNRIRRDILKDFEIWAQPQFAVIGKADSHVAGVKGNVERFYKLHPLY